MLVDTGGFHGFVFDTLIAEHRSIAAKLERIRALPAEDAETRRVEFAELGRLIYAHARGEELIVFPALDGSYELGHHVRLDRREHQAIEAMIRDIESTPAASLDWSRKLTLLADLLRRHFADEEEVVFPHAHNVISDQHAAQLLDTYEAERDLVLSQLPR